MGPGKNEHMESVDTPASESPTTTRERVVLDPETMTVIDVHIERIRAEWGDIVNVTAKQIVNYLIQRRAAALSTEEMTEIKLRFADKVKLLQVVLDRAKLAKKEGREYSLEHDLKIFETLGVSGNQRPKRRRKMASVPDQSPDADDNQIALPLTIETSEMPSDGGVEPQSPNPKKSKSMRKSSQEFDLENS